MTEVTALHNGTSLTPNGLPAEASMNLSPGMDSIATPDDEVCLLFLSLLQKDKTTYYFIIAKFFHWISLVTQNTSRNYGFPVLSNM